MIVAVVAPVAIMVGMAVTRMADFALVLAALDDVMGWDGAALTSYLTSLAEAHVDVIEANPLASHLLAFLDEEGEWNGTPSELLEKLDARFGDTSRPRGWPQNPRGMTSMLNRLNPTLRGVGWEYAQGQRTKYARRCTITRCATPHDPKEGAA